MMDIFGRFRKKEKKPVYEVEEKKTVEEGAKLQPQIDMLVKELSTVEKQINDVVERLTILEQPKEPTIVEHPVVEEKIVPEKPKEVIIEAKEMIPLTVVMRSIQPVTVGEELGDLTKDYIDKCAKMGMRLDNVSPYDMQKVIRTWIDALSIPDNTKTFLKELFDTILMNLWILVQLNIQGR